MPPPPLNPTRRSGTIDSLSFTVEGAGLTARAIIAALGLLLLAHAVPAQAGVERPPQFIVMAFDNCTELERWQELSDFAAELNRDGDRIHFTFFVSAINFLADSHRGLYEGPHQQIGRAHV